MAFESLFRESTVSRITQSALGHANSTTTTVGENVLCQQYNINQTLSTACQVYIVTSTSLPSS